MSPAFAGDTQYNQLVDSNMSVVGHVDALTGELRQRMSYDLYGRMRLHLNADFNGDGRVDEDDLWQFNIAYLGEYDDGNGGASADVNGDGGVNEADLDLFSAWYEAQSVKYPPIDDVRVAYHGYIPEHAPTLSSVGISRPTEAAQVTTYLGRMRWYEANLGRWLTRDPAGYVDGLNVYQFVRSNPLMFVDPTGLIPDTDEQLRHYNDPAPPASPNPGLRAIREVIKERVGTITSGLWAVAREIPVLLAERTGAISTETAVKYSLILGGTYQATMKRGGDPWKGAGVMAGEAVDSAVDTVERAASGDLEAIGDLSWAGGTTLLPVAGPLGRAGTALGSNLTTRAAMIGEGFVGTKMPSSLLRWGFENSGGGIKSLAREPVHVFWSGGLPARDAARELAESIGGLTLEMTEGGSKLQRIADRLSPTDRRSLGPAWDALSLEFASTAKDHAIFVGKRSGPRSDSTWLRIEKPMLDSKTINIYNTYID